MTSELLEIVELGEAESLIEMGVPDTHVEFTEWYRPSCAPYVEYTES